MQRRALFADARYAQGRPTVVDRSLPFGADSVDTQTAGAIRWPVSLNSLIKDHCQGQQRTWVNGVRHALISVAVAQGAAALAKQKQNKKTKIRKKSIIINRS